MKILKNNFIFIQDACLLNLIEYSFNSFLRNFIQYQLSTQFSIIIVLVTQ